jgi:tetratricopeptide (TPR) repeat protein
MDDLLADPSWVPVFAAPNSVVFAEDVPENRAVILRHALPKEEFFPLLLEYSSSLIASNPAYVQAHVARGDILLRLGDRAGALRSFEDVLRIAPQQPVARARVARLKEQGASGDAGR